MSRHALVIALACAACGRLDFDSRGDARDARPGDAPGHDAHVSAACDASDSELVACWPFDGDTLDYSANHNDATAIGVTFVTGSDGLAVATSAQTQLLVAESASLDPSAAVTVEGWVYMDALPSGMVFLFDNDDQYGLGLDPGGQLFTELLPEAAGGSATGVTSPAALGLGAWHHVAMRYDAMTTLDLLIDGDVVGSVAAVGPVRTLGSAGSRIAGDAGAVQTPPFIGELDDLRVWSVARPTSTL